MEGESLGPYRILGALGQGGMGRVYLASVDGDAPGIGRGERVAVKVIHPHLLETPGFFKRFLREAEIGRTVAHRNVVRCYDCDAIRREGDFTHYLVMEYVEGQTLRALTEDLGPVPEDLCRHVAREISRGLDAIHGAGVVHRDLKPENVLITEDHVVKIMDLGVARLQDEAIRLSQTGVFLGSVLYAAPEAFHGGRLDVDARADLYSLGVVLYELATGRHPYANGDMRVAIRQALDVSPRRIGSVNPQLSAFYEEVVHTLLAKDPEDRFTTASELLAVLDAGEGSTWWRDRAEAIRLQTRRPLRRIRLPRETEVYGRGSDLEHLAGVYADVRAGRGRVVLLEGEAGIGKTRVVDEFARRLEERGEDANFLFGAYAPGMTGTGGGAFATAYREHFGAGALEEVLCPYLTAAPRLVPAFAALLRGDPAPSGQETLARGALHTVFVHATRALAQERPTIVVIDDLHFAPEEGRALFSALARAAAEHRILLLGTMRRRTPRAWVTSVEGLRHAERLELQRLGPKDLARLLEEAFCSKSLATTLGHEIAVKSDGNPFLAFEIIRGLKEGLFITQTSDGAWVPTKAIQNIQVPSSIGDLVHARISGLTDQERDLLDVAACCGYEFDPEWVADALGIPLVPALKAFGKLERAHRLVRTTGRRLVFDHHYVQERLYESLIPQLREAYHAVLATTLEARTGAAEGDAAEVPGSTCETLCRHFLAGRSGARALCYLDGALAHLAAAYLNEAAIELLDGALAAEGLLSGEARVRILLKKSGHLEIRGRRDEQGAALDEALTLLDDAVPAGLALRVRTEKGAWHDRVAEYEPAREILEACVEDAVAAGEGAAETDARGHLGNVYFVLGRYAEAREQYEACRILAHEQKNRQREAMAIGSLGNVFGVEASYPEAERLIEELVEISRETGQRRAEGAGYGNLGVLALLQGRYEEAQTCFAKRLAIARETGDRHGEAHAIGHIGNTLRQLGRLDEALERGERYVEITEEIGDRQGHAMAVGYVGDTLESLGRTEEAGAHYERQLRIAEEIHDPAAALRARLSLAGLSLDLGRLAEAGVLLAAAKETARQIGDRHALARVARRQGSLHLVLGALSDARRCFEELRETGCAGQDRCAEGGGLLGLARVAEMEGAGAEAQALAAQAVETLRQQEDRADLGAALAVLGRIELAQGRREEARGALDEALAIARELGHSKVLLLAGAPRLALPGLDAQDLREAVAACPATVSVDIRLAAHHALWLATRDPADREEAKKLLDHLLAHAPEDGRQTMRESVPLYRAVLAETRTQRTQPK